MDESQLIQRVLDGDAAAERQFYDAHVDRVYGLAFRMTGDPELSQEFTQEAFIRAFDRLPSFRQEASLGTWLYTVTSSVCLNGLRKIKRVRQRQVDLDHAANLGESPPPPNPRLREDLFAAIDSLSDAQRIVFVLHDIEQKTHEEISRILEIAAGTSKARLSRAREALRSRLAAYATEWTS